MAKEVGVKIGKLFSHVREVLIPETGSSRDRPIKILATINLDKLLLRGTNIKLDDVMCWVDFKYEQLADFCYYCGKVGHLDRVCYARGEDMRREVLKEGQYRDWLRGMSGRSRGKLGESKGSGSRRGLEVEEASGALRIREENKWRGGRGLLSSQDGRLEVRV